MTRVVRDRPHALPLDEARRRVERIAAVLAERFGATCRWEDDELRVSHPSVNGTLRVSAERVWLTAELRFPVSLARSQVEAEIDRLFARELGGP